MRGWILQVYPFIHAFSKFLAEGLIKVEGRLLAFLPDRQHPRREAHAEHWILDGTGFGLTRQEMLDAADGASRCLRDVQSLTDWIWYSIPRIDGEAIAATSFAIEALPRHRRKVVNVSKPTGTCRACRWARRPTSGSASMRTTTMSIRRSQWKSQALCHDRAHADQGDAGRQAQHSLLDNG